MYIVLLNWTTYRKVLGRYQRIGLMSENIFISCANINEMGIILGNINELDYVSSDIAVSGGKISQLDNISCNTWQISLSSIYIGKTSDWANIKELER